LKELNNINILSLAKIIIIAVGFLNIVFLTKSSH
jgi:hypothetical protein